MGGDLRFLELRVSEGFSVLSHGGFTKLGVPFCGPNNKDNNILDSRLGSPYLGKPPRLVGGLVREDLGFRVSGWG